MEINFLFQKLNTLTKSKLTKEEFEKSFTPSEKAFLNSLGEVIEKGHAANIGEVHTWNGKQYKKQPNGKWLEVSESHGMTKKQHEVEARSSSNSYSNEGYFASEKHKDSANKLSDKEHTDEEVGKKSSGGDSKLFDGVRDWSGDKYTDAQIKSVKDALDEASVSNKSFIVRGMTPEEKNKKANVKVRELLDEIQEGNWHKDLDSAKVKDIIWGMVMHYSG